VFIRKTTKGDVVKLFTCEKERMQLFLQSFSGRVSFTSNYWTLINTDGYISIISHHIDNSWTLRKKILNFSFLPPPYNGVAIAEKFGFC